MRTVKGNGDDPAFLDYIMSEKFGLDWKRYELKRVRYLIIIMNELTKRQNLKKK